MLILALESSAVACSAALWGDEGFIAQSYQSGGLTHSATLLPMVRDLLDNCGVALEEKAKVTKSAVDARKAASVYEGTSPITPQDIAETVFWVTHRPAHININRVEIMPICQSPSGPMVRKGM